MRNKVFKELKNKGFRRITVEYELTEYGFVLTVIRALRGVPNEEPDRCISIYFNNDNIYSIHCYNFKTKTSINESLYDDKDNKMYMLFKGLTF